MSDPSPPILLALDGGGTGCRVIIADANFKPLGTAKAGPANPATDPQQAVDNILTAIDAARNDAGLDAAMLQSAHAVLGLAGVRSDKIANFIKASLPIKQAHVVEDRITTATGALGGGDGWVGAIGTGSFLGRSIGGQNDYLGGWGFSLGDQASGAWLGHKLLQQVILCSEAIIAHSPLTRDLLAAYNDNPHNIYDFCNDATPAEFGKLAPQITDAATKGDLVAMSLMREGADYIGRGLKTLGHQQGDPLCLTGGLGPKYAAYLPSEMTDNLIKAKGTALDGALRLAARIETKA